MSGNRVPYHLRTNKFVERQLFMDIISFARVWNGPCEYVYASMGGQFLEDFKAIHDRFGIKKLVSFEMNEVTHKRQEFNSPFGFINCLHATSGEFVESLSDVLDRDDQCRAIVWLDFAQANNRGVQLQEYETLVEKLVPGDVVKITLNANPQSKYQRWRYQTNKEFDVLALDAINEELGPDYRPADEITSQDLKLNTFASLLAKSVRTAAKRGLSDADDYGIAPLGAYRYSDSMHQMLTVTAIVTNDEISASIDSDAQFQSWDMRSTDWGHVHEVRVPDLSSRERGFVNKLIGSKNPKQIHDAMPFWLEQKEKDSIELLVSYIRHHRRYPAFGRIFM